MRGKVVVAGVGHTAFGALPGRSIVSLTAEAVRAALDDCGVEKSEVDALFVKPPTSQMEFMHALRVAEALGMQPAVAGAWDQGGAANISLIGYAAMAIEAGQCEIAIICYADTPRSGNRQVYARARGGNEMFGWYGTMAGYAMIAQRYKQQFRAPEAAFGAVARAARRHGAENPNAQLRKPLSMENYLAAPFNVEPFRRDDCALISDGGAAIVLMSARTARARKVRAAVPVLGFGQGHTAWDVEQRPELTSTRAAHAGAVAFAMAGLRPNDIGVAQIYDCFTITPLMTLEDYGFCRKGEAAHFVADGAIEIGGRLPINTSGGLLSETGMPGLQLVIEGVRQMRGEARLQVRDTRHCIVSNQGGVMHTHATLILGQA